MSWPSTSGGSVHLESNNPVNDDIDEAIVKQILQDSGPNLDKLADILHPSSRGDDGVSRQHYATLQEGEDLVDALDTLVQQIQANESSHKLPEHSHVMDLDLSSSDIVMMDHSYSKLSLTQYDSSPNKSLSEVDLKKPLNANSVSPNSNSSNQTTPSRRSQRQIDKNEKSILEKIKAENAEMLKRERLSMEQSNSEVNQATPSTISTPTIKDVNHQDDNEEEEEEEEELVIDFDNKKKKKIKRPKKVKPSEEPKKPRLELKESKEVKVKPEAKKESSELEQVIAALNEDKFIAKEEPSEGSSGRSQRTRRKPKRWDNDEVEVDFTGNLAILADETKRVKVEKPKKEIIADEGESDDDDSEDGSEFGSEDDPEKLWCICRQPHDNRFMIGCDSCEEWFHGSCVNVTKQQGRQMEKAGKEWLCTNCLKGITNGVPREQLKRIADEKRERLETEKKLRKQRRKEKLIKEKSEKQDRKEVQHDGESRKGDKKLKTSPRKFPFPSKKQTLDQEQEKLKQLIKSSKKKLFEKSKAEKKDQETKGSNKYEYDPISKVVPIVRKPEVKKKHKEAIDPSVQDLFKAEPIKKMSGNSTPTTPTTPGLPRKPSFDQSKKPFVPIERQCAAGCGKTIKCDSSSSSVYCNLQCIEKHVKDSIILWKKAKKLKEIFGKSSKDRDLNQRLVVVEKSSGRLLAGKDGIPEKDIFDFIKANPSYEIFKTKAIQEKKPDDISKHKSSVKVETKKSEEKRRVSSSSDSTKSSSTSSNVPDIRLNVRKALKETLESRHQNADDLQLQPEEIKKIAFKIEDELFKVFNKDTGQKYRTKYRSLVFNLKDVKNEGLFRKVLTGQILPEKLVRMSAEELASSELAKWREREKNTMLEMIKRDAVDKAQQIMFKKTHKGEEIIEAPSANETKNEPPKETVSSAPATSLLDDLMGNSNVDTTSEHRSHLFSNDCRICTKQVTSDDDKYDNKKSLSSNNNSSKVSSTKDSKQGPKRVRVELESANKILQEAAKLSTSNIKPENKQEHETEDAPTSTVCLSSPEAPSSSSSDRPVWKGTIFMQDVAKFSANAVKVSNQVAEFMSQDISDQIVVCGRIAPEQVLDYVKKLQYSSRTDIAVVKFVANKNDKVGYEAFFNYLHSRGRYGVVGNNGKVIKDFYIFPLPKNGEVPEVLLPFDGPGLDKKSSRTNLLLGIIIRTKKSNEKSSHSLSTSMSTSKSRSYTPPPKLNHSDNDDSEDVSYTPPRSSLKKELSEDEPYDPEEADLSSSNSMPSSSSISSIHELMEQIAKSSNPVEMTSSVLATIATSSNIQLQRQLLDQLTAKVEEQRKQLEEQRKQAEEQFNYTSLSSSTSSSSTQIPGLDGQFGSLNNIEIPDNLKDILTTVRLKEQEIEQQQQRLRVVAAAGLRLEDPIVKNFGNEIPIADDIEDLAQPQSSVPEAEPMEIDDDDDATVKSTIIEVNNPPPETLNPAMIDPRLRSKKQKPLNITNEVDLQSQVAAMSADELMQKAKEQMAALAQMEQRQKSREDKIKIQWKKKRN